MLNDIRYKFFFLASVPLLIGLFFLSLMFGTVSIPFEEVYDILFNNYEGAKSWEYIISEFRLPKAITALLAGAGLAVAG